MITNLMLYETMRSLTSLCCIKQRYIGPSNQSTQPIIIPPLLYKLTSWRQWFTLLHVCYQPMSVYKHEPLTTANCLPMLDTNSSREYTAECVEHLGLFPEAATGIYVSTIDRIYTPRTTQKAPPAYA